MLEDKKELTKKFEQIKEQGWIKSMRKGAAGIGYTFESLLGKPEENFNIPDFGTIEIKTHNKNSPTMIKLFCATPDGDGLFAIKILREKFGYQSKNNPHNLIFRGTINAAYPSKISSHYLFKIKVNYEKQKVKLVILDLNYKLVYDGISWSFDMLKEKLYRKMEYLAIVSADRTYEAKQVYFKYEKINFYKLKSFNTFINLINNGLISIIFTIGTYKNGRHKGEIHDHGTQFAIKEKDITKLYDEILD